MGGFFDFAKGKSGAGAPERTEKTYIVTNEGKARLKMMAGTESEFSVLAAVNQFSPAPVTLQEISENSGLGPAKAKEVTRILKGRGWLAYAGSRNE